MSRSSDIIVIGAGVVGCAIAYELARRGASVEIIDDRAVGMGATQASAGVLAPFIEAREGNPLLDLAVRSLDPTGRGQQRWSNRWKPALNAFAITFEGRIEIERQLTVPNVVTAFFRQTPRQRLRPRFELSQTGQRSGPPTMCERSGGQADARRGSSERSSSHDL